MKKEKAKVDLIHLRTYTLPTEGFVRPKFVAYICGVSVSTLYSWVKNGEFPAPMKDGRMTFWSVEEIRSYLKEKQERLSKTRAAL